MVSPQFETSQQLHRPTWNYLCRKQRPRIICQVVWDLWSRRNNLGLGKPTFTLSHMLERAKERQLEFTTSHTVRPSPTARRTVAWSAPGPLWYKINFDGDDLIRRTVQDSRWSSEILKVWLWLHYHSWYQYLSQSQRWKPWQLEEHWNWLWRLGLIELLEGDSEVLIQTLKTGTKTLAQFGHIANDILYLASHFTALKFSNVHRHCNKGCSLTCEASNYCQIMQLLSGQKKKEGADFGA